MPNKSPFARGLAILSRDLHQATGFLMVWKGADPRHWGRTPVSLGQHRHPYCLTAKRSALGRRRCMAHDNLLEKDLPHGDRPCIRRCPFGVRELLVPIFTAGRYLGCLQIGSWRDANGPSSLAAFPGRQTATAAGRLAKAALLPLLGALDAEDAFHDAAHDTLISDAIDFIGRNLNARLRAAVVARAADLSVSRFLHRFRDSSGETFRRHVERRIMAEACRRLMDLARPVEDIGDSLGFRDSAAFVTAFRRVMGESPGKWRGKISGRQSA